jgi:hypothetical protein
MKKIKFLALMMLAGSLVFTSCTKDDDDDDAAASALPSVTFQGGNNSLDFDGSAGIDVNVDFTAEAKVSTFKLTFLGDSLFDLTSTYSNETSGTYRFQRTVAQITADLAASQGTVEYVFTLVDKDQNARNATYTVTTGSQGTAFATEILTGNFWHVEGPNQGAYDLDGDATVSSTGSATTKSMINTDPADASATSSFTGSWNSGNGTEFVKANSFDYANATVEAATSAYTGTTSGTVTNPAVNDVYIAKKGSIYYVIKITELTPDASKTNAGQIKFSYKKN